MGEPLPVAEPEVRDEGVEEAQGEALRVVQGEGVRLPTGETEEEEEAAPREGVGGAVPLSVALPPVGEAVGLPEAGAEALPVAVGEAGQVLL